MFFTVIVTIYNGEAFLASCLDSILRNSRDNYDVIIVDDGSTDGTGKICDDYADKYDHVKCVHTANQGIGNARQAGLDEASGEYIIFVDGDDAWDESFSLVRMEEEIKKSQADLYVFGFILRRTKLNGYSDNHYKLVASLFDNWRDNQAKFLSYFPSGIMFPCWNKIFRRQCVVENSVISVNQQMEDFRFVLEYLDKVNSVKFLSIEPYLYYKREGVKSLTKSLSPDILEGINYCHRMLLKQYDSDCSKFIYQIMAPQYIAVINKCLKEDEDNVSKVILKSISKNRLASASFKEYLASSMSERITLWLMGKGWYEALKRYRSATEAIKNGFIIHEKKSPFRN